jgi:hypothetical protein
LDKYCVQEELLTANEVGIKSVDNGAVQKSNASWFHDTVTVVQPLCAGRSSATRWRCLNTRCFAEELSARALDAGSFDKQQGTGLPVERWCVGRDFGSLSIVITEIVLVWKANPGHSERIV